MTARDLMSLQKTCFAVAKVLYRDRSRDAYLPQLLRGVVPARGEKTGPFGHFLKRQWLALMKHLTVNWRRNDFQWVS